MSVRNDVPRAEYRTTWYAYKYVIERCCGVQLLNDIPAVTGRLYQRVDGLQNTKHHLRGWHKLRADWLDATKLTPLNDKGREVLDAAWAEFTLAKGAV